MKRFWSYEPKSFMKIRIRHYGRPRFEGHVEPGMVLPVSVGDAVYRRLSRSLNGQRWVQLFRIRMLCGKPTVHLGKKFGKYCYTLWEEL